MSCKFSFVIKLIFLTRVALVAQTYYKIILVFCGFAPLRHPRYKPFKFSYPDRKFYSDPFFIFKSHRFS
jgi:hypothetical protein